MATNKPQTPSLIDTFSAGFIALNRRLWLVLVPLVLNLYLWYGTQLSFAPLISDLATLVGRLPQAAASEELPQLNTAMLNEIGRLDMRQPVIFLNLTPTLTPYVVSGAAGNDVAGLPIIQAAPQFLGNGRSDTIVIQSIAGALLAIVLLNAIALLISAAFLTRVAESARGDRAPFGVWLRRSGQAALALLGYAVVVVGLAIALGFPFVFFAGLLLLASPALGGLALSLLFILWFWVQIFLSFGQVAIVVSGIGPIQAIRASFTIVRRSLWTTLGFLAISTIITFGTGVLWHNVLDSTIGVVTALVGSAYIGTGLLLARMIFYRQQLQRWQASTSTVRPLA